MQGALQPTESAEKNSPAGTAGNVRRETAVPVSASQADWKQQKEEQARVRKLQNDIRKTEEEIAALEERNQEIDALLATEEVFTNVPRLLELNEEKKVAEDSLAKLYDRWEELSAQS